MISLNNDKTRHVRVRGVVAYPAVTVAFVVSLALALTPFGPSQVSALAATATPTPTSTVTTPDPTTSPAAPTTPATTTDTVPVPTLAVSPGAAFGDHHVMARIEGSERQANYLPVDEPVPDAAHHQRFRARFRLHNAQTVPTTATPRLEFRPELGAGFVVVPEETMPGIPIHVAREWVPSLDLAGGTMQGPLGEDIAVADFRMRTEGGLAITGHHSMAANPDQPVTLPSDSYTEQEFTIELTTDAQYLTAYELRVTDAGTPLTGTDVATIRLGEPPAVQLSPGQRQGVAVGAPNAMITAGVAK